MNVINCINRNLYIEDSPFKLSRKRSDAVYQINIVAQFIFIFVCSYYRLKLFSHLLVQTRTSLQPLTLRFFRHRAPSGGFRSSSVDIRCASKRGGTVTVFRLSTTLFYCYRTKINFKVSDSYKSDENLKKRCITTHSG